MYYEAVAGRLNFLAVRPSSGAGRHVATAVLGRAAVLPRAWWGHGMQSADYHRPIPYCPFCRCCPCWHFF